MFQFYIIARMTVEIVNMSVSIQPLRLQKLSVVQ